MIYNRVSNIALNCQPLAICMVARFEKKTYETLIAGIQFHILQGWWIYHGYFPKTHMKLI